VRIFKNVSVGVINRVTVVPLEMVTDPIEMSAAGR
jgi:hypothetical protein